MYLSKESTDKLNVVNDVNIHRSFYVAYYKPHKDKGFIEYWSPRNKGVIPISKEVDRDELCRELNSLSAKASRKSQFLVKRDENKIAAIKRARQELGVGLKEAKEIIEDAPESNYTYHVLTGNPKYEGMAWVKEIGVLEIQPVEVCETLNLSRREDIKLPCGNQWELWVNYTSTDICFLSSCIQAAGGDGILTLNTKGNLSSSYAYNKTLVITGSLFECEKLEKLLKQTYNLGRKAAALKLADLANELADTNNE